MGRRRVQVEIVLFDVLAVIALLTCESEQTLFEYRISAVPKRQREANELVAIADAADSVFAPSIRPAPGMIVGKVFPGVSISAVVFAHGSPLALREIRPPTLPVGFACAILFESLFFGCHIAPVALNDDTTSGAATTLTSNLLHRSNRTIRWAGERAAKRNLQMPRHLPMLKR